MTHSSFFWLCLVSNDNKHELCGEEYKDDVHDAYDACDADDYVDA